MMCRSVDCTIIHSIRVRGVLLIFMLLMSLNLGVPYVKSEEQSYNGLLLSTNVQKLKPGQLNNITFTLNNTGSQDLTEVILTINIPSTPQLNEAPMYILNGDGKHYIGDIDNDDDKSITERIFVNPKSANSIYLIAVNLSYKDQGALEYSETRSIGFTIESLTLTGAILDISTSTSDIVSGRTSTILLNIKNIGDSEAINMEVSMTLPSGGVASPIALRNSDGNWVIKKIGVNETTIIPFEIFAAPSSAGNVYLITLSMKYSDTISQKQIERYLSMGVPFPKSQGSILNAKLDDQTFASGVINNRVLKISNTGDEKARNILLSMNTPNTQSIALIDSSGPWQIDEIEPGKSYDIPIKIFITTAATGATYNLPISMTYIDSDYVQKQEVFEIGVIVFGSVSITVLDSSTYPAKVTPGKTFSITSTIINLGTTNAQSVILTPKANANMRPFSNSTMFIGDLSVNVPSSITITYIASDLMNQTYSIDVEFSYRLSTSQTYSEKLSIPVKITLLGQNEQNNLPTPQTTNELFSLTQLILIGGGFVIVLIAAFVYIRRRRKM